MKIIKRSGSEVTFDINKIIVAIEKANDVVEENDKMTAAQIDKIAANIQEICENRHRALTVEEIQDLVEKQIMGISNLSPKYFLPIAVHSQCHPGKPLLQGEGQRMICSG